MLQDELIRRLQAPDVIQFREKSADVSEISDLWPYLRYAVEQSNPAENMQNLYMEMGVYSGNTFMGIRRSLPTDITLYGFDTFTGLPEDWELPGNLKTDGVTPATFYRKGAFALPYMPDTPDFSEYIVGDVRNTLVPFLEEHNAPISFVHYDLDLYSSTKYAIENTYTRFKEGTVLVFDDIYNLPMWEHHAFKALLETIDIIPFEVRPIATIGWHHGWASATFKLFPK